MNQQLFANNFSASLAAAIAAGDTTANITVSKGRLPTLANGDYIVLNATQAGSYDNETAWEGLKVTAWSGNLPNLTITFSRAAYGTARGWALGDKCDSRIPEVFLNAVAALLPRPGVVLTGSRDLTPSDFGLALRYSGSADIDLTEVAGLGDTFTCTPVQLGTGKINMRAASNVGQENPGSTQGINTFLVVKAIGPDQFAHQNPVPAGPVCLLKTAIPFIAFSSWTMGANGALSLSVALPVAYPAAFVYFPADAIATGVPAGYYYTTFSSTTSGTVYNNRYTSGKPVIPASPTAFSTTAGSVTTQITTAITGPNIVLPGGSLGPNGYINIEALWQSNNSAQVKAANVMLASWVMAAAASMSGTAVYSEVDSKTQNTGVVTRQINRSSTVNSQTGAVLITPADTGTDLVVSQTSTLATAATGDYVILLRLRISYEYGA